VALRHSPQEHHLLAEAALALVLATIAVRTLPFRRTARFAGLSEGATASEVTIEQLACAERVGRAVRAVASRTPWTSTCLMEAVAGAALLRRRRIPAEVHFGVAKDSARPDGLAAHAWLTCGGRVLTGDGPQRQRYATLGVYSVCGNAPAEQEPSSPESVDRMR
jgi:hypothetical protein